MGCAKDIVENTRVARFYFSNFPLGHSAGKPFDDVSQQQTVRHALQLIDTATAAETTVVSEQRWSEDDSWEQDFWDISQLNPDDISKLKAAHEQVRKTAATMKRNSTP